MGCICDHGNAANESYQYMQITKDLERGRIQSQRERKCVLIGTEGSGKSTIFKQLQYIHGVWFTQHDRMQYKQHIYHQCISQMQLVLENSFDKELSTKGTKAQEYITDVRNSIKLTDSIASALKYLWNEPWIQKTYERIKSMENVYDSSVYFWEEIDRISASDYVPCHQDILLLRRKTTKITEQRFASRSRHWFRIIDSSCQESQNRKIIHFFENISAILFVASLSCYDSELFDTEKLELLTFGYLRNVFMKKHLPLPHDIITLLMRFCPNEYGDNGVERAERLRENAMTQQLSLFNDICNHHCLSNVMLVLFLNKRDLFEEKIKSIPLNVCPTFNDYHQDNVQYDNYDNYANYELCLDFIRSKFHELNDYPRRKQVYSHVTCALDRDNIQMVFDDVQHYVISMTLAKAGLI